MASRLSEKPKAAFGSAFVPKSWLRPKGLKKIPCGSGNGISTDAIRRSGRHPMPVTVFCHGLRRHSPLWQSLLRMSMVSISVLDPGKSSNCMEAFTEALLNTRHMRAGLSNQVIPSANSVAVGYARMWYGLEKTSVRQHYKEPARRPNKRKCFLSSEPPHRCIPQQDWHGWPRQQEPHW